jgi:phosphohistidine phosphatase
MVAPSSLQVYLIRHGIAAERTTAIAEKQRPLTPEGHDKTQQVAQRLQELGIHFDQVLTSPLVRARQTAEILRGAGLTSELQEFQGLAPGGCFADWLLWLQDSSLAHGQSLGLVGHQPDLSQWAEILLWGEARGVLILKKAGIIGITLPAQEAPVGNSQLFWLTPPRLLL